MSCRHASVCAALVICLSFALLPAAAAAKPQMFDSELVKVGAKVYAEPKATNNVTFTGTDGKGGDPGTVTCTKALITGTVKTNNVSLVEIDIESSTFSGAEPEGKCASTIMGLGAVKVTAENMPWCFTSSVWEVFSIRGGSCAAGASNVKLSFSGAFVTCTYERASMGGSYVGNLGPAPLAIVSQTFKLSAGPMMTCPAEGHFTGLYDLRTDVSPFESISFV